MAEAEAEAEAVAVGLLNLQPVALPISFGKTIKKSWVLPGRKTQKFQLKVKWK